MQITLRCLTLNVWGIPFFSKERKARIKSISEKLSEYRVDVAGFQETWLEEDRRVLREAGKKIGLVYSHYFHSGVAGSGLLVLSRYPFLETAFHRFLLTGRPERSPIDLEFFSGKGIGLVRLDTPAGLVDFYDVHPIAQYQPDNIDIYQAHRAAASYEIAQFVNLHSPASHPLILLGDLNMRPEQFAYRALLQQAAITDAYSVSNFGEPGYTYSPANPYASGEAFEKRLDYVLYRKGGSPALKPLSAQVVFKEKPISSRSKGYTDHYGVLVEFELIANSKEEAEKPGDTSALLDETAGLLRIALVKARRRRSSRLLRMLASAGMLAVQFRYRLLFRSLVTFFMALELWLALLVLPEEIHALEGLLSELETRLEAYKSSNL
jgi:sphingomyelin phosphodiesterase 2